MIGTPSIEIDNAAMAEVEVTLAGIEEKIPHAIIRAISRTTRALRSMMVKVGAQETGAKQKDIRTRVWRNQARRVFYGKVRAGAVGWKLRDLFDAKTKHYAKSSKKRPAAMARINRKWTLIPHAFMATMPITGENQTSRHMDIFVRKGRARLPIKFVRTESLTTMIEKASLTPKLVLFARDRFNIELLDAADYYKLTEGTTARAAAPELAEARAARAAARGDE